MSAPDRPLAVVMGLSPTGLHAVRALGRAGLRVIGVAEGAQAGRASRYLAGVIDEPDPARRLAALCALAPETPAGAKGRPVLMPTSDQDVAFVIAHAQTLARHFAFQGSYADGLAARIMDKASFYALCEAQGVAYPALHQARRADLPGLAGKLRFPVMIKPAEVHRIKGQMRGRKGWTVADAAALAQVAGQIPEGAGTLLVQEIVPGPESAITLACAHVDGGGVARQVFTARKLRQYPPGFGSASLVQSHDEAETARIMTEFLAATGYRGIAAAEFKPDPATGRLQIIEINVRPSLWFALSSAAGREVVVAAWRDLAGLPPLPETPQRQGVRWRYLTKDLWSALFYLRTPGFLLGAPDIGAAGPARARVWAVFDARDPLPVLAEVAAVGRKAIARVTGRGRKR